ncbi:MAG: hypothetical protein ACP5EK_00490 [Thermoplasmatota archaeon]
MKGKIMALVIALVFLTLTVPVSPGVSQHMVTFAKYLPDGSVEHVTMAVEVTGGETPSQAIARRCAVLLREDARFQSLLDQQTGLYLIVSAGDGMHFALPPALFEIRLLRISFNLIPSIIYCSYSDPEASTDITPLGGAGNGTSLSGPHKVLAGGFVGIIGWDGVFSSYSAGFAGLTFFIWTSDS